MYIVAITGASGSILGIRLMEELLAADKEVAAIISEAGWKTLNYELYKNKKQEISLEQILISRNKKLNLQKFKEYKPDDFFSSPASGTSSFKAIIIAPASMKTLAAIAHGYAGSLITRAADVALKENRQCILVPRESPLSLIHLENMVKVKQAGADIVPPIPGFYTFPKTVDDVVDFIVGKVLNLLGIEHDLFQGWCEE